MNDMNGVDPIFDQAKQIFPDVPDDELHQGIAQIRQQAPQASDQELLQAASAIKKSQDDGSFTKQMVNENVKQKYGIGDRQAILDRNAQESQGPNVKAGLAALGAGLQGGNAAAAGNAVVQNQQAEREQRLSDFDKQKAASINDRNDQVSQEKLKRETDPTSAESKMAQSLAIAMGMDSEQANGLTAAKFKDFSPALQKKYEIAEKSLDRQERTADRKEARDARMQQVNEKQTDMLVKNMKDDLDPNKARGGNLARNQAQIDQAERLQGLYTEANGDIRNLDSRQMEELAIGMNKMLSGSSAGSTTQVEALLPHTVRGNSQKLKEWLLNDPQGSDQKAFVARMAETVDREKHIASDQVRGAQVQRLSAYSKLKKNNPEAYQQILSSYGIDEGDIDENGRYKRQTGKGTNNGLVRMKDPKGNIRLVPKEQVTAAKQAGGIVVDEAVAQKPDAGNPNGV